MDLHNGRVVRVVPDTLEKQHYISYFKLGRENLIKFSISGWKTSNTVLEYIYPCLKDVGFFFFPIAFAHELISLGKSSEMDIILDLWLHTIYQDNQVQGSDKGPVVYFRNGTGNPLTNFSDLAQHWGISKSTVSRVLNKLESMDYLSLISFPGRHGSVIYLNNYLSTMFQVSDVMIDKEEVSVAFHIPFHAPEPYISYIPYPTAWKVIIGILWRLRVRTAGTKFSLNLSCLRLQHKKTSGRKSILPNGQQNISIQEDILMRKNSLTSVELQVDQGSPMYHGTWKLLKSYRDAVWNPELAVQQVRHSFQIEFGSTIDEFLDSIYLAGADVGGTRLEEYAKSIERSNKMLNTLTAAVDLMRTKHKHEHHSLGVYI